MSLFVDNLYTLDRELVLPCGAKIKNPIAKSAMSDSLGDGTGRPTETQINLYERWAEGGVGLSIIGEVQADPRFPESAGNLVLSSQTDIEALRKLTQRATINGAHIWPQIGHAGALSNPNVNANGKGPSELKIDNFRCSELSTQEVEQLPKQFAQSATIAQQAGFTGIQIHAGHGFLLSQFLSPLFNQRTDQYGGSVENRCRILTDVIEVIRAAVGQNFPIGIKINTSDQIEGGLSELDSLQVIQHLNSTSLDLIELSGGSYFPGTTPSSDRVSNGPYFLGYAEKARELTTIPLVVTGGFKNSEQVISALSSGNADMVGLARALVLEPKLVKLWLKGKDIAPNFPRFNAPPEGGITAWYTMLIQAIGQNCSETFALNVEQALIDYQSNEQVLSTKWISNFGLSSS
ncbi:NADH:flavin oxidoreductase/NADH oxidase family protein [Vibrio astriarenae]|uniref:NADH:flavin oxidoreductase/NADH oxidase family protein n=1 Tax=Vibrio astriarenae TaxID=1481923 RepID=UPI0037357AC7